MSADQTLMTLAGEDLKLAADIAEKDFRRGQQLFQAVPSPRRLSTNCDSSATKRPAHG